jgi:hypothetical protein
MKASAREWIGGTLIAASAIAGIVLSLAGVSLATVEHSAAQAGTSGTFSWSGSIHFHWPLIAMVAGALAGLFLLLRRGREKTKA